MALIVLALILARQIIASGSRASWLAGLGTIFFLLYQPVFGNGIPGFRAEYLNYQAGYFQTHPDSTWASLADDMETPYNEFLKIFIEQGIVGLMLFICIVYFLRWRVKPAMTSFRDNLI